MTVLELASALAARHPDPQPPLALEPYLAAAGVRAVRELAGVGEEGACWSEGGGLVIGLAPGLEGPTRRWALARQLARALAATGGTGAGEQDAEAVAAELIMPEGLFGRAVLDWGPAVESIPRLAGDFGVPLEVAARRYCQLLPFRVLVAWWRPATGGVLRPAWQYRSPGLRARIPRRGAADPAHPAFAAFTTGSRSGGRFRISLGGPPLAYYVECLRLDAGVLSLFILEKHAEVLAAAARRAHRR